MYWSNVLKSKSACLNEQDGEAQKMPKQADTDWGMRSDNEYGGYARRNHPLILTQRQALSQADEPTATSFQGQGGNEAGPFRTVYQRSGTGI